MWPGSWYCMLKPSWIYLLSTLQRSKRLIAANKLSVRENYLPLLMITLISFQEAFMLPGMEPPSYCYSLNLLKLLKQFIQWELDLNRQIIYFLKRFFFPSILLLEARTSNEADSLGKDSRLMSGNHIHMVPFFYLLRKVFFLPIFHRVLSDKI